MSSLEQARRFSVSIIGPLHKACVRDTLANLGFERVGGEFKKEDAGKHVLAAGVYQQFGANYILIYNLTKLLAWRKERRLALNAGESATLGSSHHETDAQPIACRLPACLANGAANGAMHSRCQQHSPHARVTSSP